MASLRAASRKQHPENGQKASSFAPVSQGSPLAYHMTPEFDAPPVPQRVQTTGNKGAGFGRQARMHAPKMKRGQR